MTHVGPALRGAGIVLLAMILSGILLGPLPARAHQFAPALLALQEVEPGRALVLWKQPLMRVMGSRLQPVLPGDCEGIGEPEVRRENNGLVAEWEIACPQGLLGKTIGVEGIADSRADVILRVELADGRSFQQVLRAEAPTFSVPEKAHKLDVAVTYGRLGIEHIATGFDHLLFVLGLTLLVGWGRKLIWTITAFTIGHSITLALAALGLIHLPQAPIEAGIALSIYVLAIELVRRNAGRRTLMERVPWLVAGGFGLLHGMGFAGALAEVGLPVGEIPLALFGFNVGIELGQLAFVLLIVALLWSVRGLTFRWPAWARNVPAYAIGSLAAFWLFERLAGMLPSSA